MATLQTTEATRAAIDWPAILAGALAASALSIVLIGFGSALGLSLTSARPFGGLPVTAVVVFSALWLALVYVSTFAAGGYLAGRLRSSGTGNVTDHEFSQGAHGFLVWALGTLLGAVMLASLLSATAAKTVDAAAKVTEAAGQVAASAGVAGGIADALSYSVDAMLRPTLTPTAPAPVALSPRDLAEIVRIFSVSLDAGTLAAGDRDYLATIVAARTGIVAVDAGRRVDQTFAAIIAKRSELEARARNAAEALRKAGILTAFLSAAVALAGLLASVWAAGLGARDRSEERHPVLLGQSRLW